MSQFYNIILKLCLQVWRERELRVWRKKTKERVSGRNRGHREKRVLRGLFFFKIYTLPVWGTKNLYWRRVLGVWKDLYEFFKYNLCCYNILKIQNILITSITLSLSKTILFKKMWKISQFSFIFFTPQSHSFSFSPNSQTKP